MERRRFLKLVSGAGVAAAARPAWARPRRKVRGVIWIWVDGLMSQFHAWDPRPGLRGMPFPRAIDTSVSGIRVSEWLPVCAAQMKHLTLVRSLWHEEVHGDFATELMHTGISPLQRREPPPSIGAVLASELGERDFPLPAHVAIDAPEIAEGAVFGEEYLPFRLNDGALPFLRGDVGEAREAERSSLLAEQNREWSARHRQAVVESADLAIARAERMMATPLVQAFDLSQEPMEVLQDYGGGLGQKCLLARRLVQAGCPFVEVGFPSRAFAHSKERILALDRGLGTLVKDLVAKSLLGDTVVACVSAYGHPPPLSDGGPWSRGYSVVVAGGTFQGGVAHGDTGPDGNQCSSPVTVPDLLASIYSACGLDWEKEYTTAARKKVRYVSKGQPVPYLF